MLTNGIVILTCDPCISCFMEGSVKAMGFVKDECSLKSTFLPTQFPVEMTIHNIESLKICPQGNDKIPSRA